MYLTGETEGSTSATGGGGTTTAVIGPGVYLVGTDISAGRYKGNVIGEIPYWCVSRDANGSDIVANSLPTGQFYIDVSNGQYLELRDVEIAQ